MSSNFSETQKTFPPVSVLWVYAGDVPVGRCRV